MNKWLKRIRGAFGTALTWAVAWSGVGLAIGLLNVALAGAPIGLGTFAFAIAWAKMGFLGGAIFSAVLGIAEGRRSFDQMSIARFAGWGALGGLILAIPIGIGLSFTIQTAVGFSIVILLGTGSAAGSLALARAAEQRQLVEGGEEALALADTHEGKSSRQPALIENVPL